MVRTLLYGLGCCCTVVGVAGIPDDLQSWWAMLSVLDIWGVRAALAIVGIIVITYPFWARAVRHRFDIPDNQGLVAGLAFWWGWTLEDWRERRRQKRRD